MKSKSCHLLQAIIPAVVAVLFLTSSIHSQEEKKAKAGSFEELLQYREKSLATAKYNTSKIDTTLPRINMLSEPVFTKGDTIIANNLNVMFWDSVEIDPLIAIECIIYVWAIDSNGNTIKRCWSDTLGCKESSTRIDILPLNMEIGYFAAVYRLSTDRYGPASDTVYSTQDATAPEIDVTWRPSAPPSSAVKNRWLSPQGQGTTCSSPSCRTIAFISYLL